jgi:hypothetical protein
MSARSFRSVFMVASCAGAALSCYLVSLRVASERAALENVETQIVLAQRDLRVLQTEIGTRGRLAQLERWNVKVLALSAPSADQFLGGSFELARLTQPERKVDFQVPVVLASAPAPGNKKPPIGEAGKDEAGAPTRMEPSANPRQMLQQASYSIQTREVPAEKVAEMPQAAASKSKDRPATTAKPAARKSADQPGLAAAKLAAPRTAAKPTANTTPATAKAAAKKSVDKTPLAASRPLTKPVRLAKTDPLSPMPAKRSTSKETATAR